MSKEKVILRLGELCDNGVTVWHLSDLEHLGARFRLQQVPDLFFVQFKVADLQATFVLVCH